MTENNAVVGFVRDYLADGPQWSADLAAACKDAGYSSSAVGRARQSLGCVKRKIGKAWRVALPEHQQQLDIDPTDESEEHPDFDPLWNTHLVDGSDELVGDGRFTVASTVAPNGDVWVWGIDRDRLGYVDDNSPDATDWTCFTTPPPHERLGRLPDDTWSRVWDTTTNPTQQPEGNQ